jgi:UDP-MurNAc hydroxylase
MRLTMLGHASLFVETADCRILMDPVLWDPHEEGLFAVCPTRELDADRLPAPEVILISHRHFDHFDVRSLAALPRSAEVLCPSDPLLVETLGVLGFRTIIELDEWTEIDYGGTRLLTTPSLCTVPEIGVVVRSGGATLWNQVDTILSEEAIDRVRALVGGIDLLVAPWQPMLETSYVWGRSLEFPYAQYAAILDRIHRVEPAAVCPGANGFRYLGPSAWLNRAVFPVSRERFCEDARGRCPWLGESIFPLDPGQVLEVALGVVARGEPVDYARTLVDDRDMLDFRPNQVEHDMRDDNPRGFDVEAMHASIEELLRGRFAELLTVGADVQLAAHRRWGVVYQLAVVFPDGVRELHWVDFRGASPRVGRGRTPLANFHVDITASALHGILTDATGLGYAVLGGHYRIARSVLRCTPESMGWPDDGELADPLWLCLPAQAGPEGLVRRELARWGGGRA